MASSKPSVEIETPYSPGPTTCTDSCRASAREHVERLVQLARRLRQLPALRQPPEETERGLLALRPVDRAHSSGLQPELEQLAERRCVFAVDPAFVDRRDDVGEAFARCSSSEHRDHGLRLGTRHLAASPRTRTRVTQP